MLRTVGSHLQRYCKSAFPDLTDVSGYYSIVGKSGFKIHLRQPMEMPPLQLSELGIFETRTPD
jgi:hypothetical protein